MSLFLLKTDSLGRLSRDAESSHFAGELSEMHPIGMNAVFAA
jgi:hypothetical protein